MFLAVLCADPAAPGCVAGNVLPTDESARIQCIIHNDAIMNVTLEEIPSNYETTHAEHQERVICANRACKYIFLLHPSGLGL